MTVVAEDSSCVPMPRTPPFSPGLGDLEPADFDVVSADFVSWIESLVLPCPAGKGQSGRSVKLRNAVRGFAAGRVQAPWMSVGTATVLIMSGDLRSGVAAVATIVLDGRPVAVTGSHDETLRVWDLGTGRPVGPPLTVDPDEANNEYEGVTGVRAAVVDGHPYVVAEYSDGYGPTVRVWDLATHEELTGDARPTEISESMIDDIQLVPEETQLSVNGRTYAVTVSPDPELERPAISFRDLDTDHEIDDTPLGPMSAFATGTVSGRAVAVVASGKQVRLWDSAGAPATVTDELVFPDPVDTVAVTQEGRLVIGFGRDLAVLSRR